jgi:formylglycine-generating enzyme
MLRRHRLLFTFFVASIASRIALIASTVCGANITIDTVPIGNPGNADDPATGNLYGGVAYNYRIEKYDVTVGQYTAFLNAVAATDAYSLYNTSMATDLNIAGIAQSVTSPHTYSVIGSPNHPITYVTWGDAARFANWLSNGQPNGVEGPGTTETGAYTLNGAVSDATLDAITRNAGAKWFIPSESEWYKAAYYDPAAAHYWQYATGTNTTPTSAPPGSTPNTANFLDFTTGYAVTGSTGYSSSQNYLTDAGAYSASASPYGTYDQNGDVFQWNETLVSGAYRVRRGGSWGLYASDVPSSLRNFNRPSNENDSLGFRVATVPEPSTIALAVVACGLIGWRRKRFSLSWARRACRRCVALMLFALLVGFATDARADVFHMAPGSFESDR